jgi:predicted ATPase
VRAEYFLYGGKKITENFEITFEFGDNAYRIVLQPTLDNTLIFVSESFSYWDKKKFTIPFERKLGGGHFETLLFDEAKDMVLRQRNSAIVDYVIDALKNWRVYHFHDTSTSSYIKGDWDINDNQEFHEDGRNLAAFLYQLQHNSTDSYEKIVRTVQQVAPFFRYFDLQPSRLNKNEIRLRWRDNEIDMDLDAHHLSDGTLRFICLATLLLQPNLPPLIIIDEPELGLHPSAITLLASMLKSASRETQVVIATQSVTLVNQFEAEDVIVVERQDKQSVFKRLDTSSLEGWLEDYGIGDLWEKNVIGGRPKGKVTP